MSLNRLQADSAPIAEWSVLAVLIKRESKKLRETGASQVTSTYWQQSTTTTTTVEDDSGRRK